MYDKILHLPLGFFTHHQYGDVVSRAVNDTQEVEHTILNSLRSFMTDPVALLIYLSALFYLDVRLTLFTLLLLPVTFFFIGRISRKLRRQARNSKERLGSLLSHVEETLGGLRVIKGFNAQDSAEKVFDRINTTFTDTQRRIYRRADLASPLSEFLGVTVVMIVLVVGGNIVLMSKMDLTAELFITYIALFTQVIEPLKSLSTAGTNYRRGLAALDRVHEILDAGGDVPEPDQPLPLSGVQQSIRFQNLSFAYDAQPVLRDVDFEIRKGEVVALVGPSGAGKSTLVDLLERFYDPTSGQILMDGTDIRQFGVAPYRAQFALVSQDVVLFNDTLYHNVTMGRDDVPEEQVWAVLEAASIADYVRSLPGGLSYALSDRGMNLSGGQRQRISVARAFLRDAPVLLLDEATSAMDGESERQVQAALSKLMQGRTVLVVAHRLSTVRDADRIVVLSGGRVVETGTHEELVDQGGLYSNMVKLQEFA